MDNSSDLHNQIASALTGVVKQIKAIRYYPPKHPALKAAAAESLRGFEPILSGGSPLALTVRKEGFLFDDCPVAKTNQVLVQLANFCFARRIQYLTFLADLKSSDLHHFVHYLLLDPQVIQKQGGIQVILEKARLTTIWANIRDLEEILERRQEIEALPEDPGFDPATVLSEGEEGAEKANDATADLAELLARLEREKDDGRFQRALQELIPLLRTQLSDDRRPLVLQAFLLLCRSASGRQHSEERREQARLALGQLTSNETADYLVRFLFDKETPPKVRDTLGQILAFLGGKIVPPLMELLAEERNTARRKVLSDILARTGPAAMATIGGYLDDERWYVVRSAVAILGDVRSQDTLDRLIPLLEHDEIRVRREVIRTLARIGGPKAVRALLQVAAGSDHEMRRQAILSLGAMRAAEALPTLVQLLRKSDWSQRGIDLRKDAIRALGEIRDPEATPELLRILAKKRWLHRQLNDELRTAAAAALGDIGDESTRKALDKATHDRCAPVARAAAQAIKQLDKAKA